MEKHSHTILDGLYGIRLLLFLEESPQTNKYRQIILNAEEFKKVSLNIGSVIGKLPEDKDKVAVNQSDETYTLPDLQEIYE